MKKVLSLLRLVIPSRVSVLVYGETGSGKEVIARAIHNLGPRRNNRFVPVDCGAIPDTLVESELFGHREGAFTDAKRSNIGLFEVASGGTLFMDEVADMSPAIQPVFLRALQDRKIRRIGETRRRAVDVRIVSATGKDLDAEVRSGRFREDLLYRLNVVTIHVPPLRARREDIPLLADFFLERYARRERKNLRGISPEALARLCALDYRRNNVRELKNIIEAAVVLEQTDVITLDSLRVPGKSGPAPTHPSLLESEKMAIVNALVLANGTKVKACGLLGISRPTLDRKIRRHRIDPGAYRNQRSPQA